MADFCLKCFNKFNYADYKRYEVIEEWGICDGCASYKNVVVGIRGRGVIKNWLMVSRRALIVSSAYQKRMPIWIFNYTFHYILYQKFL